MILETNNLKLIPHVPAHLLALTESVDAYEKISGQQLANGLRDFLLSASPDFFAQLRHATEPDPWKFGFALFHKIDNVLMGMCGFVGPPDSHGFVEIAYGIAPDYQGKGYATEAAAGLVELASRDARVKTICAHTLPQPNASTRVLEKCGFAKIGEIIDPETNRPIWRWERKPAGSTSTS